MSGKVGTPVPRPRAEKRAPYITVTHGMSGYFAVMLWWNTDMGGFYEPWDTGIGRYPTEAEAEAEAEQWADEEELLYVAPKTRQPDGAAK